MADPTLTERQVYILGHSLCGSEDRPYRNYYAAHPRNFSLRPGGDAASARQRTWGIFNRHNGDI